MLPAAATDSGIGEDGDVEGDCRHDVVGLAAVDQLAGLVEEVAAHQQHKHRRHRERQAGHIEHHRPDASQKGHEDPHHHETRDEAEVLATDQRVGESPKKIAPVPPRAFSTIWLSFGNAKY